MRTVRIGTRRSPLALVQARAVRDAIHALGDDRTTVEIVEIDSAGDLDERSLREIGQRGVFASALEQRLQDGTIDAAVHSSKDLTLDAQHDLVLAAWMPRADPRDALVNAGCELEELPVGAAIATGSARRASSLAAVRADLVASSIRGNVATRIARSRERGDAGLLLAMAGLQRLGMLDDEEALDVRALDVDRFVPEAGQGAVVVQAPALTCPRTGFDWTRLDDVPTRRAVQLERAIAHLLGGGCERPVGVHVRLAEGLLHASWAPSPGAPSRVERTDIVGLEIATLLSVRAPVDVDEAATWTARRLAPQVAAALGAPAVQDAPR